MISAQTRQLARTMILAALAFTAALSFSALSARGATDGPLGATSTGTVDLNIAVPNLVRISMLNDVNLGSWAGGNMTAFERFCVFSSTGAYNVTATSANGVGNRFYLDNAGTSLRYVVRWFDSNTGRQNLRNNQTSNTFDAVTTAVDCGGVTNSRLRIRVRNNWAAAVPAGTYADTLTLLIQPQ